MTKKILERNSDPLPGQAPPAQAVRAPLVGAPLGTGLGSSANRGPVLNSIFCDEKLPFRRSRGHGDVKLVEKVSNAPSFGTIGQELPENDLS